MKQLKDKIVLSTFDPDGLSIIIELLEVSKAYKNFINFPLETRILIKKKLPGYRNYQGKLLFIKVKTFDPIFKSIKLKGKLIKTHKCQSESKSIDAQEAPKVQIIKNKKTGKWINLYKGRSDLLGIYVQQFPDNLYSAPNYEGKHPSMIIYVFNSMKARQIEYKPDGSVVNDFWWKVNQEHWVFKKLKKY